MTSNVQRLLLCGALAQELPYGGSLEGPAPHHPFGPIKGAVGTGGERCPDMYTVPTVHLCQIDTPTKAGGYCLPEIDPLPLGNTVDNLETWYNDAFLSGLHQAAEISKHRSGHCFNCQKEGHHWHQCKETLFPELSNQADREREERKKKALNPQGGIGMKGGHAPTPLARIGLAPPQVPDAPTQ